MDPVTQSVALLPSSVSEHITPGKETILSIFPMELSIQIPHAGPQFVYIHPPAQRDLDIVMAYNPERTTAYPPTSDMPFSYKQTPVKTSRGYTRIVVHDTYQLVQDWTQEKPTTIKKDIPAIMVADDLVRVWSSGRMTESAAGGPGIMRYQKNVPLDEQLESLWQRQTLYFRELVFQADRFHEQKQWNNITNLHRKAAEYLGGELRPWFQPLQGTATKECPACQNRMERLAIVCAKCNTNIVKFAKEMAELGIAIQDPVLDHFKIETEILTKTSGKPAKA